MSQGETMDFEKQLAEYRSAVKGTVLSIDNCSCDRPSEYECEAHVAIRIGEQEKAALVAYEKGLRDDYRRIKRDYDEIAQPYSSLCKEIDDVTDENEKLEKELTDLRAENERLKADVIDLTEVAKLCGEKHTEQWLNLLPAVGSRRTQAEVTRLEQEISRLRAALDRQLIKAEALESDNERLEREIAELRDDVESWKDAIREDPR